METGEALGPGRDGEICVKGPTVMKGLLPENIKMSKKERTEIVS